jgi:Tfp pilus assembly protein PilO
MASLNLGKLKLKPIYMWQLTTLILFTLILMLVLSFLIYKNFTYENKDKLFQLQQDEQTLKDDLTRKVSLLNSIDLYREKESALNDLYAKVGLQFPTSEELPNVLIQINQVSEDSDFKIKNFTPKSPAAVKEDSSAAKGDKINSRVYSLSASGTFDDAIKFFYQIAKIPRVMELSNFQMSRVDNAQISISCDVTIFYSD